MPVVSTSVPEFVDARLREKAKAQGRSISNLAAKILEQWADEQEAQTQSQTKDQ